MNEYTIELGPITLSGPNGVEFDFKGITVRNLSADEAQDMAQSIATPLSGWLKFDFITGAPTA